MNNKEGAFKSKAQSRLCFALKGQGKEKSWDCKEWADKTNYSKLPEKKRKSAVEKKEKTSSFNAKVAAFATGLFFSKTGQTADMSGLLNEMGQPTDDRGINPYNEKTQLNDDSQLAGRVDIKPNVSADDIKKELLDINTNLARSMKSLAALQKVISETVMKEEGTSMTPTHSVNVSKI